MVRKKNLTIFEGKRKGAKSPELEKPCLSNLVHMHILSTSTCMNFWANFIFWPCGPNAILKENNKGQNLWNWRGHAHKTWCTCNLINLYLHEFFWADSIFWPHGIWSKITWIYLHVFLHSKQFKQHLILLLSDEVILHKNTS